MKQITIVALLVPLIAQSFAFPALIPRQESDELDGCSTLSISAAIPSPTADTTQSPDIPIDPEQPWCTSKIFCQGPLLQAVQLAGLFTDSKTFVDKPTSQPTQKVLDAFNALSNLSSDALAEFVTENFGDEGSDLVQADIVDFKDSPSFLEGIYDNTVKGWMKIVNSYWTRLARGNVENLCDECESTLIPLNRTFVVPGGRFRENYYWDTYFVLEGLYASEIISISKNMIENFLDEIETIGFIPNAARTYYLDRSQPPFFTRIFWDYLENTNDTSFMNRALPLIEKEMEWWKNNRTRTYESPYSGKTHQLAIYAAENSAPRPEGFVPDYQTAYGEDLENPGLGFSQEKIEGLYADLASGAESGEDYSSVRWTKEPLLNRSNNFPSLRTLNLRAQVPVDLNALLYNSYDLLSKLYKYPGSPLNDDKKSSHWEERAKEQKDAIIDMFWDKDRVAFYDFNTTSGDRAHYWSLSSFFPYFCGIYPDEVANNEETAKKAFSSIGYITANYNGSIPSTMLDTGMQWDYPNVWPPHVRIVLGAIKDLPDAVSKSSFADISNVSANFKNIPENQFGIQKDEFPGQPILGNNDTNITTVSSIDTLGNVGKNDPKMSWRDGLLSSVANRYITSALCSWYDTGGSIPGLLERLPQDALEATNSANATGQMFEKFNAQNVDAAGSGGEYEVQDGFGWTNGLALWIGKNLGEHLVKPTCPPVPDTSGNMLIRELRVLA